MLAHTAYRLIRLNVGSRPLLIGRQIESKSAKRLAYRASGFFVNW